MEAPLEGKDIKPGKGKIIAFEHIPKQIERDELDEAHGYESTFISKNNIDNANPTESCYMSEIKSNFYDDEIMEMFVNHPALETM